MNKHLQIEKLILGSYQTNCYVLRADEQATDCLIIDTGLEAEELIEFLKQNKLNPAAVVFTHGHADHIKALPLLRQNYPDIKVCIHKLDADFLTEAEKNLSALEGISFTTEPADVLLENDSYVDYASIKLKTLHTPGHTPGGICLYSHEHNLIFTGDTLFAGSIGNTEFPYADQRQLLISIKEKILPLPDETTVYTGHGPGTTIAEEKKHNPFLRSI